MEETKQTTPTAPKKVRRVGRFAFALLLIAAGAFHRQIRPGTAHRAGH